MILITIVTFNLFNEVRTMENKLITKLATAILTVINVGLFAYVWIEYYNKFAFQKFMEW